LQPLVLSHFTLASSLGAGVGATLAALREQRSGLAPCAFETVDLATCVGEVHGVDGQPVRDDLADYDCRNNRLAQMALRQDGFESAVAAARDRYGARRIGLFLGTSTSGVFETERAYRRRDAQSGALPPDFRYAATQNTFSLADFTRRYLGLTGPAAVVSSACSSSAKVFGSAARMIAAGLCDAAVVGGVDTLCLTTLYGFHSLELTSSTPCRPYDEARDGISIGEAGGFVLLEKPRQQDRDGSGRDAILLLGVGDSCDAYHMSSPHPEGLGASLAMQAALRAANLAPGAIDYINLHGTATRSNDAAEDKAVFALFGGDTPCSSTKGATGHTLGAAGVTEAVISALAIRHGFLPGGLNTRKIDPALRSRYLLRNESGKVDRVLSNSFGFGGTNCCLVLGRAA
jgi:3-oxoacyl-[acyl-carrier-protein] synthase-1